MNKDCPTELWAKAHNLASEKRFQELFDIFHVDSVDRVLFAATMFAAYWVRIRSKNEGAYLDLLEKHGVNTSEGPVIGQDNGDEFNKKCVLTFHDVLDKSALFDALLRAANTFGDTKGYPFFELDYGLTNLSIIGEVATAMADERPVAFKKSARGWRWVYR
jgi:hypothetical protein